MATADHNREARQSRAAWNQAVHRGLNDEAAARRNYSALFEEYVCECSHKTCTSSVSLTPEEYDEFRRGANWFIVAPGHASSRDERVVAETARYQVVEKIGAAADLSTRLERHLRVVHWN
jgi:hypothetical protein